MAEENKSDQIVTNPTSSVPVVGNGYWPVLLSTEIQLEIAEKYYELDSNGRKVNTAKALGEEYGKRFGFNFTEKQVHACVRNRKLKSLLKQQERIEERLELELVDQIKKIEKSVEKKIQDKWVAKKLELIDQFYYQLQRLLASLATRKIAQTKTGTLVVSIEKMASLLLEFVGEPRRKGGNEGEGGKTVIGTINIWWNTLGAEEKKKIEEKIKFKNDRGIKLSESDYTVSGN